MSTTGTPAVATAFMLVGSLQFAVVISRYILPPGLENFGWWLALAIVAVTLAFFGLATLVQRTVFPERRAAFALGVLYAGLAVSLTHSIVQLLI